ncbi:cation:proton antiporter [Xanthomonas graminis]|uniref:Sodium:proton antiporter n=2 Tax=Xanthomonas translucens group TaxID=3390202 RepID=A0A1M4L1V7_9XANT|nr:cation:proton antiporter [Xanthomonas translucens]OAX61830.1 sodium:proton antiporter [Xanthomonas translucens pv. graminis]UKE53588.1 cation:proton antiporter [Xanthomonas translucens pv. graminis]WIH07903.1 cation:proton antiporter [Xanthomonas translucens pv. graminis]WIH13338.1 cation:proton antiporter [Xanthomonas translucens pv. graminis]WIH16935.1 cation:proton antiporter [Xanthomonas translucens pv. graminis]
MSHELIYLLLIFALLVIPRALQRFKLPAPLTCLLFGIVAMLAMGERAHDTVIVLLATLGISSLFLFAGLEVDPKALRRGVWPLLLHLLVRGGTLFGVGWLAWRYAALPWQAAGLLALALLTPSTGFIIDSLGRLGLSEEERFWVTSKAIAGELLALAALFVILQAGDPWRMGLSSLALLAMLVGLPLLFVALGRWVAPQAPGSEFSLLVMVGLIAAYITYSLGVYYLVGAFIAGLVARLLRQRMPLLASDENLQAVRLFASFFVPFYFFNAGTKVPSGALSLQALGLGLALTACVLPLRIGIVWLQRRLLFGEDARSSLRVSLALAPTLIFTLVLAGILRERFAIADTLFGALLLYAALSTLLPSLLFRMPFDVDPVEAAPLPAAPAQGLLEAPAAQDPARPPLDPPRPALPQAAV